MGLTPLTVAMVAMGLLVVSVGFEVLYHRSYFVDVAAGTGWQTIGTSGDPGDSARYAARPEFTTAGDVVEAPRDGTLQFRVRVDNAYPWSFSESYDVRVGGVIVAEGELTAAASAEGTSTFTIPASTFYASIPKDPERNVTSAWLDVQVGSVYVSGSLLLQEVR